MSRKSQRTGAGWLGVARVSTGTKRPCAGRFPGETVKAAACASGPGRDGVAGIQEVVAVAGTSRKEAREEIASVPVALAGSRVEADLIVGLLRSNGLRAVVAADDAGGQEPQLQIQGVRVLVTPSEEAPARQLLADADGGPA